MFVFDELGLVEDLLRLEREERCAFALAVAFRSIPNYEKFSKIHFGEVDQSIREFAMRARHRILSGSKFEDITSDIECVTNKIPGEEFGCSIWRALGEDACASLAYALRCESSGDVQDAAWAARRGYEGADQFVVRTEEVDLGSPEGEREVLRNPVVQTELARQARDIAFAQDSSIGKILDLALQERMLRDEVYRGSQS